MVRIASANLFMIASLVAKHVAIHLQNTKGILWHLLYYYEQDCSYSYFLFEFQSKRWNQVTLIVLQLVDKVYKQSWQTFPRMGNNVSLLKKQNVAKEIVFFRHFLLLPLCALSSSHHLRSLSFIGKQLYWNFIWL